MNNTVMKDVEKAEHAFTSDEAMRYQYMLREKAIRDYYSGLDEAKQESIAIGEKRGEERGHKLGIAEGKELGLAQGQEQGLAQGREQGVQQEKIANIIGMLREGIDISIIAKITSCSIAEIQHIANEHSQLQ